MSFRSNNKGFYMDSYYNLYGYIPLMNIHNNTYGLNNLYYQQNYITNNLEPHKHQVTLSLKKNDSNIFEYYNNNNDIGNGNYDHRRESRKPVFYFRILDYFDRYQNIGFINNYFFIFDPELYMGIYKNESKFIKRHRIHFIGKHSFKIKKMELWICWSMVLSSDDKKPLFRKNMDIEKIPELIGKQSFKAHVDNTVHKKIIMSEDQNMIFEKEAKKISVLLEDNWDGVDITDAIELIKNENLNIEI